MMTARKEGATVSAALLVDGEPSSALTTTAEERSADLIVLGAVHDRSLADRLLGTVATEVTKRAGCDVLVVRPVDEQGDLEVPEDAPRV
ncbi:universal stress protein [Kribbella sp. NPDC026596]|uniref:universal stress protein n=1 Tax=Kribbella sp. NPDC026596 TaxID=3155122 RepID=UPI0033F135F1